MNDVVRHLMLTVPTLISLGLLYWFTTRYTPSPEWFFKVRTDWKKINVISLCSGAVVTIITALVAENLSWLPMLGITSAAGLMTFVGVQSIFTDPQARAVDRRVLYLAMVPPLAINLAVFLVNSGDPTFSVWVILICVTTALLPFPFLMGPSDARALMLVAIAAFPPLGMTWTGYGFGVVLAGIIGYTIIMAVIDTIQADSKKLKTFFKYFIIKHSIPAVPFILLPFALMIPLSRIIELML